MRVTRERYEAGQTYSDFRREVGKHDGLWNGVYDHTTVPEDAVVRLRNLPGRRHVLVLAEDWCGDAASLVPVLARMADAAIVYDDNMKELGSWGPRPGPAQARFREKIRIFREEELENKDAEVYRPVLKWYRQDRGRHTIDEFLNGLERGGEP